MKKYINNKKEKKEKNKQQSNHNLFVKIVAGFGALAMFGALFFTILPCFR